MKRTDLLSPSCSDIPCEDVTYSAPEHLGVVDKLRDFLSDQGDLFIIKLVSGLAHSKSERPCADCNEAAVVATYSEYHATKLELFAICSRDFHAGCIRKIVVRLTPGQQTNIMFRHGCALPC